MRRKLRRLEGLRVAEWERLKLEVPLRAGVLDLGERQVF